MNLLLDTHSFIWWDYYPSRLSDAARKACNDPGNSLNLSIASVWELRIKVQLGKLKLRLPWQDILEAQRENRLQIVPITTDDILALADLPMLHRDPFDRLLVAQARRRGFHLVSSDPQVARYDVPILW